MFVFAGLGFRNLLPTMLVTTATRSLLFLEQNFSITNIIVLIANFTSIRTLSITPESATMLITFCQRIVRLNTSRVSPHLRLPVFLWSVEN